MPQFKQYDTSGQKTKEEALLAPISQTVQSLPALWMAHKLEQKKRGIEEKEMTLKEMQIQALIDEHKAKVGTGEPLGTSVRPGSITPGIGGPEEQMLGATTTPLTVTPDTEQDKMRKMGSTAYSLETDRMKALKEMKNTGTKPPVGYKWTPDGDLEAIPGGPAYAKEETANTKKAGLEKAGIDHANKVIAKVDSALEKVSGWTTGAGAYLKNVPLTKAKDLATDLNTIKANLGFAELQAMRQNSPTGGALGQVSTFELDMLQATVSSLDQAQSPDQIRKNLGEIRVHYENWKNAVQQARDEENIQKGKKSMTPQEELDAFMKGE